jgi:hypothetical protein
MATSPTARVFRATPKSSAGLFLQEKSATLVGDDRHFVVCDEKGVTIKGPVSFVTDSLSKRTGGLFVGINDFLEMIPSTIITPIPKKIPFPPTFMLINIAADVAFFMSLLV